MSIHILFPETNSSHLPGSGIPKGNLSSNHPFSAKYVSFREDVSYFRVVSTSPRHSFHGPQAKMSWFQTGAEAPSNGDKDLHEVSQVTWPLVKIACLENQEKNISVM